LDYESFSLLD